jgi:hypothetical protein
VLPPASAIATTGWTGKAWPADALVGWLVNTSFVAAPAATLKALLCAAVNEGDDVALSLYAVPSLSIEHPEKLATPDETVMVVPVPEQVRAPGPPDVGVPEAIERVTLVELSAVTVRLEASWTTIVGWTVHAVPAWADVGAVVEHELATEPQQNASLLAGPDGMSNAVESATVRTGLETACSL